MLEATLHARTTTPRSSWQWAYCASSSEPSSRIVPATRRRLRSSAPRRFRYRLRAHVEDVARAIAPRLLALLLDATTARSVGDASRWPQFVVLRALNALGSILAYRRGRRVASTVTPVCFAGVMAMAIGAEQEGGSTDLPRPACGDEPALLSDLERAVHVIGSVVAKLDIRTLDGRQAMHLVSLFTRCEHLGHAGKTLAAARAALAQPHAATGHRSAAHWLAEVTGEPIGEATRTLELGRRLTSQQALDDALRSGNLSRSRAAAVSDAAIVNPSEEHALVGAAAHDDHRTLQERCRAARARSLTPNEAARKYEALRASRYCRTWTDAEGAVRFDARLTPEAGALVRSVLAVRTRALLNGARRHGVPERHERLAADALVTIFRGNRVGGTPPFVNGDDGGDPVPEASVVPVPPAIVHVRVDAGALRRGSVGNGEQCEIPGVGPVPVETARSLLGDAWLKLLIVDGVDIATVCHVGRTVPATVRTALIERDPVCVVPGCGSDVDLEIDHWQVPFADGGPTSITNLARLCHHHHFLKTFRGFRLSGGPGRWRWHPPDDRIEADGTASLRTSAARRSTGSSP